MTSKINKQQLKVDTGTTNTAKLTEKDDPTNRRQLLAARVRELVGDTSERYIARPQNDDIFIDALNGIGDFKKRCRWAQYWRNDNIKRVEHEQGVWANHYHHNPSKMSAKLWKRSKEEIDFQWPDP